MTVLAELGVNYEQATNEMLKEKLCETLEECADIKKTIKEEKKNFNIETLSNLRRTVEHLTEEVQQLRIKRDASEEEMKSRKSARRTAHKKETDIRKKRGEMDKPLQVMIEMEILP